MMSRIAMTISDSSRLTQKGSEIMSVYTHSERERVAKTSLSTPGHFDSRRIYTPPNSETILFSLHTYNTLDFSLAQSARTYTRTLGASSLPSVGVYTHARGSRRKDTALLLLQRGRERGRRRR